jgi:hypothetical protein
MTAESMLRWCDSYGPEVLAMEMWAYAAAGTILCGSAGFLLGAFLSPGGLDGVIWAAIGGFTGAFGGCVAGVILWIVVAVRAANRERKEAGSSD